MSPERLLVDLWLGLVALAVLAVFAISLAWVLVGVITVAAARHRPHRLAPGLESLAAAYAEAELAEIDATLEAIAAQERPPVSSRRR